MTVKEGTKEGKPGTNVIPLKDIGAGKKDSDFNDSLPSTYAELVEDIQFDEEDNGVGTITEELEFILAQIPRLTLNELEHMVWDEPEAAARIMYELARK